MSTNKYGRQAARFIMVDLGVANIGAENGVTAKLPQGALLLTMGLQTVEAFNSGTTATATVGDGTTTFVNAVDVKTTGAETAAGTPKFYPQGGTLTWSLAETGTAGTAGRAIGYASYIQLGVGDEVYG